MSRDSLALPWQPGDDPLPLREREWLATNGLGGYASGTVLGPPTRRYHGLLVANLAEPNGRHVLLQRLDELVDSGGRFATLGGPDTEDGSPLEHAAQRWLQRFELRGNCPVWTYAIDGNVVERSVVLPHGRNALCVRWRLLAGHGLRLRLRPYGNGRRQDAPLHSSDEPPCRPEPAGDGGLLLRFPETGASLRLSLRPLRPFIAAPLLERAVLLRTERARGYPHREHMHSPGFWTLELSEEQPEAALVAGSGEAPPAASAAELFAAEEAREAALFARAHAAGADGADPVERRLVLAADQFIVQPGNRRDHDPDLRSVIAGYPWFNDWGRDTMIALEGLTLATGRHAEARAILRTFAGAIRDGLLPNLYPEGGREALYHTVDASLWYFHALERYVARSGDAALVGALYPALASVIDAHVHGTRHGIGVDPADGLVRAGADDLPLTWMDAKVDDWVVTPRRGKPVEIQALWYNALRLMAGWARQLDRPADAERHDALAERVHTAFGLRYWSAERGHLLDVIDGPGGDDPSLRPNQIFALSLAHPVLDAARWPAVLDCVGARLLTPVGLRTLAPGEPGYQPRYEGALRARDAAYHQGTVWPWLLGHYVDAWLRVHGPGPRARALLAGLPQHLLESGLGQISEVFDAEAPHREGGCIAQAWSVAELLRAWQATRGAGAADG